MNIPEQLAIVERVTKHLLTQNVKSYEDGTCLYRGPHSSKCAIGCLIDDEHYKPGFEGMGVVNVLRALNASGIAIRDAKDRSCVLLEDLQSVHDDDEPPEWRERLSAISVLVSEGHYQ